VTSCVIWQIARPVSAHDNTAQRNADKIPPAFSFRPRRRLRSYWIFFAEHCDLYCIVTGRGREYFLCTAIYYLYRNTFPLTVVGLKTRLSLWCVIYRLCVQCAGFFIYKDGVRC
jgi:hypothetical protein